MTTAAQLVEAVREFLERDVRDKLEGRVQFHTRVAINALALVERELTMGPEHAVAHAERLRSLGVESDADLAAAIRDGTFDDRWDEVLDAVRADIAAQLAVANPGYAE